MKITKKNKFFGVSEAFKDFSLQGITSINNFNTRVLLNYTVLGKKVLFHSFLLNCSIFAPFLVSNWVFSKAHTYKVSTVNSKHSRKQWVKPAFQRDFSGTRPQ